MKKVTCLILALLLCISLCGCSSRGTDRQIIYPIDKDPEYLDPQIVSDEGACIIIANCFEGLVGIDAQGEIIPAAAEKWQVSKDGLVYTFTIREDCRWRVSSYAKTVMGEELAESFDDRVTAEDFAFGLRRALRPETKSPVAASLYSIENAPEVHKGIMSENHLGITVKNEHTLEIRLSKADPDFLYTLTQSGCMPCDEDFFKATGGRYGLSVKYLLYNGPFYISNWADDVAITLKRSDVYYAKQTVAPSSLYISINNEQQTRLKKTESGTYGAAPLTDEQAAECESSSDCSSRSFKSSSLCFLLNCQDAAFSDMSIRRAVASSLDRATVYSSLSSEKARGIIPGAMLFDGESYREAAGELELFSYRDPDALFDKGLEKAELQSVEVNLLCSKQHEGLMRSVMQSWQAELGVRFNVTVEAVEQSELKSRVASGNYQIAFGELAFSGGTAFEGLERFTSDSVTNPCGFADERYDELVAAVKTAEGTEDSLQAMVRAERYLISACPIIPVCEGTVHYAVGEGVSELIFNSTGEIIYFRYTLSK